jgi:long-chain acyl-CoA synthetase
MQTTFSQWLLKHATKRPDAPAMHDKKFCIWQAHSLAGMTPTVAHCA